MLAPEHGFWKDEGAGSMVAAQFMLDGLPNTVVVVVKMPLSATSEAAIEAVWDSLRREWRDPLNADLKAAERFLVDAMYQPRGYEQMDPDALFPRRKAVIWERRRPWRQERTEA